MTLTVCCHACIRATTRATVLALARDDFARLLGQLADIRTMWRFEALRKVWGCLDITAGMYRQVYLLG